MTSWETGFGENNVEVKGWTPEKQCLTVGLE
jgi:hypothetical protein